MRGGGVHFALPIDNYCAHSVEVLAADCSLAVWTRLQLAESVAERACCSLLHVEPMTSFCFNSLDLKWYGVKTQLLPGSASPSSQVQYSSTSILEHQVYTHVHTASSSHDKSKVQSLHYQYTYSYISMIMQQSQGNNEPTFSMRAHSTRPPRINTLL